MKLSSFFSILAALELAVFSLAAGSGRAQDIAPPPSLPASKDDAAKEAPDDTTANATWLIIKDYAYDKRSDFSAGVDHMIQRLDAGIKVLDVKRAGMNDDAAKDWDFNMKELNNARAYLQSMNTELDKATESTWHDATDKIAQAWQRARDAYDKVKSSTTS